MHNPIKTLWKQTNIFYGYVIVAASILILFAMHGAVASYGIFLPEFQTKFGWERAVISGGKSVAFLFMGIFSAVFGPLTDKYGPRIIMTISGIVIGLGLLLSSQINSIWQLYLFYGLFVGIGMSCGDVASLSTVARWFVKRRSLMSGVVKTGTGIGIMVMPLIVSWFILNYNWRIAFIFLGVTTIAVIVSLSQLLKRDPAEMNLDAFGYGNNHTSRQSTSASGLTSRQILRTWQFWVACTIYFFIWFSTESIMVHIAPHAVDLGWSAASAASMVSIIGGMSILGRLAMGMTGDHITNRRAVAINLLVLLLSLILLQIASAKWMLYIFVLIYGFAHGGFFALHSPLMAELFGVKSIGTSFGMLILFGSIGGVIGPVITGRIFDVYDSYNMAFLIMIIEVVLGLFLIMFLKPAVNETSGREN